MTSLSAVVRWMISAAVLQQADLVRVGFPAPGLQIIFLSVSVSVVLAGCLNVRCVDHLSVHG